MGGKSGEVVNEYIILSEQQRIRKIVIKNMKLCLLYSVVLI